MTQSPAVLHDGASIAATAVGDGSRARRTLAVFAVLLGVFLLYAPSLGNEFVWDDTAAATAGEAGHPQPLVAELRPLGEYFTHNWWPQHNPLAWTYRPLTTLSFALRHAVAGDDPRTAHMLNVLLHVLTVGLCMRLLRVVGAGFVGALLGGLAFGVHALHSEVVTHIVGLAELLAFAGGAGGALCLCAAVTAPRPRVLLHAAALLLFAVAFFSKESALAWVVFAPICAAAARRERHGEWRVRTADGCAALAVVLLPALLFLWLRQRMIDGLPAADGGIGHLDNPLLDVDTATRLCSAVLAWGYGLLLTLLPFRLQIDYGPAQLPIVAGPGDPWFVGTCVAAAALAFVALQSLVAWQRRPLVALAAAAFLGFSFVTSNVPMPVFMMFAERIWFTPSLGLALLVAWCVDRARVRPRLWPATLLAVGVWVGTSGHVAWQRNFVWRDDSTAIAHGVVEAPGSVRLNLAAGVLALRRGDPGSARRHFETAAWLDPKAPQAWLELARLELHKGDRAAAAGDVERARQGWARDVRRHAAEIAALAAQCSAAGPR